MNENGKRMNEALNKLELDVERHLLETTVRLSDGTEGLVYSRGPKNDANLFLYNCHLCGVANLPGERCLQTHISGRKHQRRLNEPVIDAVQFNTPLAKPKANMSIAPGEPVPPGFEDEVRRIPELQPFLDSYRTGPLIGLEYVAELMNPDENEPAYLCLLCDKRGDPRTIIAHITSYNHRLKYLEKHFPAVIKEIAPYRYNPDARNLMPRLVQTICDAIEERHGRLVLNVFDHNEFNRNRSRILQDVIRDRHFTEKNGPTFVNVIDKKSLEEQLRAGSAKHSIAINIIGAKRHESSPPGVRGGVKREKDDFNRRSRSNLDAISSDSNSPSPRRQSPKHRSNRSRSGDRYGKRIRRGRSRSNSLSLSPPPRRAGGVAPRVHRSPPFDGREPVKRGSDITALSKQASEFNQEKYKKDRYRLMVENAVKELEAALKEHEKNPEKHPLYPEEWKTFWNRRYKELQAEKKDPNKYDYKPEWIIFWTKRMKELHLETIDAKKLEIRKLCGLDELSGDKVKDKLEVIDISDEETSPLAVSPVRSETGARNRRDRKSSPGWSRERERDRERDRDRNRGHGYLPSDHYHGSSSRDYHSQSSRYGARFLEPEKIPKYEPEQKEEEEQDDGPLTVVGVLRLLTALEEQLGSLGPKIIDLLAKALALEKIKANSSDEMLLNEDTSVFFETVKEKLKGQILAGVLDSNKVKAVKKAVKNIAAILHQVATKEKSKEENKEPEDSTKAKLLRTDILDRHMISSKLAAALVMQERTDITKDDMDRLINVFILLVKLSKERSSLIEVKDILLELGIEAQAFEEDDVLSNLSKVESKDSLETAAISASSALDSLTDSDLQTLLQNFKHLSSEEQHHLIAHLKKLESSDPIRVEKLRKFVNVKDLKQGNGKSSPEPTSKTIQSNKQPTSNSFSDDENDKKQRNMIESDDDDDYNFDDVVKAASKNLKGDAKKEESSRPDSIVREHDGDISNISMGSSASATANLSLSNTQNLIANLLGSLQKNASAAENTQKKPNLIPTIGNTRPVANPPNPDGFFSQQQQQPQQQQQQLQQQQLQQQRPGQLQFMNQPRPNLNYPQKQVDMFDNAFYSRNNMLQQQQQQQQQQQMQGYGAGGPGGLGDGNFGGQFNSGNLQNNFGFNQFNPNLRPQMPQGNFMNPQQPQQQQQQPNPNYFNQMPNQNYF